MFSLYSTQRQLLEEITPNQPDGVLRIYCCGPTVYNFAHIGNFRTFLVQDVLRRLCIALGYKVKFVRNITDVDDKTIRNSQKEGVSLKQFTEHWTDIFHKDCERLNILAPDIEPRATGHIAEQIEIIRQLIETNHAYKAADGSVYFRLSTFPNYGKVSGITVDQLQTQSENSAGQQNISDEYDRDNVHDFALWKAYKPEDGDIFWNSPWGKGRPGWHIECSAMARKYLGDTIDIHGGGVDLCFPHHENEVAQSESVTGKQFVKHWFHSAHLQVEGQKMSKSLGNLYTLDDLERRGYSPAVVRYALISGHYRQVFNFTFSGLDAAQSALKKIQSKCSGMQFKKQYVPNVIAHWEYFLSAIEALKQDLNVPKCLGEVFAVLKNERSVTEKFQSELELILYILGLREFILCDEKPDIETIPEEIIALAKQRQSAKLEKKYAEADQIREQINSRGWDIKDRKDGYDLVQKK